MPLHVLIFLLAGLVTAPGLLRRTATGVDRFAKAEFERLEREGADDEVIELSILKLKNAKYRRGRPLADWVQGLDGKRVRITGYMAIGTLEGLTEFELVPESCECGKSKPNHLVMVTLTDDVTRFIPGRFALEGVFEAGEKIEDGFVTSVYRLTAESLPE